MVGYETNPSLRSEDDPVGRCSWCGHSSRDEARGMYGRGGGVRDYDVTRDPYFAVTSGGAGDVGNRHSAGDYGPRGHLLQDASYGSYAPQRGPAIRAGGFAGEEQIAGGHRGKGPKGYRRSDERIQEDVCGCLSEDDLVDASEIECDVRDGVVRLAGTVRSREEKRRAEDLVERLSGVVEVHNEIRVARDGDSARGGSSSRRGSATERSSGTLGASGSSRTR